MALRTDPDLFFRTWEERARSLLLGAVVAELLDAVGFYSLRQMTGLHPDQLFRLMDGRDSAGVPQQAQLRMTYLAAGCLSTGAGVNTLSAWVRLGPVVDRDCFAAAAGPPGGLRPGAALRAFTGAPGQQSAVMSSVKAQLEGVQWRAAGPLTDARWVDLVRKRGLAAGSVVAIPPSRPAPHPRRAGVVVPSAEART